jgi:hypothetical protein
MSAQPPIVRYRTPNGLEDEELGSEEVPSSSTLADQILRGLTWVILFVVLGVWLVVGAIFWIPLILRSMVLFSVSLIEATLEGNKPAKSARILRESVTFYRRGFVVATDVILRDQVMEESAERPFAGRLFREVLWAVVLWYLILLFFGIIETSPIDAWNWCVSFPWGEAIGTLLAPFRG